MADEMTTDETINALEADVVGLRKQLAAAKEEGRYWACGWCGKSEVYDTADTDYAKAVLQRMQEHDLHCEKNPLVQQLAAAQEKIKNLEDILKEKRGDREIYPTLMREFDEGLLEGFAFSDDLVHELHWFFRRTIEAYAERGLPFIKRRLI